MFQFAVDDLDRLDREWAVTTPGAKLTSTSSAIRNKPIFAAFVFTGCKAKADGQCDLVADFTVTDPDGKQYAEHRDAAVWPRAPLAKGVLMRSDALLGMRVEPGEPLGRYMVRITLHDRVAGVDIATSQMIEVREAE